MAEANGLHIEPEDLVQRYFADPRSDLRDLIMERFGGLVERIARRFSGLEPFEDLVQVGYIGLLNALSKYDPNAGVRFNTYATYLVAGEVKHYLRDRSQTIRQPAWLQELRHKVTRTAAVLQQEYARPATNREIADHLGVAENSVVDVFQTQDLLKVASLDSAPSTEDDAESDVARLDASDFCVEQLCVEDRVVLEDAMGQLRDLERQVLLRFHFDAKNQTEIANDLGISSNYVSHILRQSLAKLRKILVKEEEQDALLRRQMQALESDVMDPQTGAYTERYFHSRLAEELHRASCQDQVLSLVVIRFEGTEKLRAFYGERSVTDFMADATAFLKDNVRRLDIVCRYGDDGFAILLPFTGSSVEVVRRRLLARIADWIFGRNGANGPISVSIGQAAFPDDARTKEGMLLEAKSSMVDVNARAAVDTLIAA